MKLRIRLETIRNLTVPASQGTGLTTTTEAG